MDADSRSELRAVLEELNERLLETADWIEKQNAPPDESIYNASVGFCRKRCAPLLTAFRAALNAEAFGDVWMQEERFIAFPEDVRVRGEVPPPRFIGNWSGYRSFGDGRDMFIERLIRGWVPGYDFGESRTTGGAVVTWVSGAMTVSRYVTGLRHLAIAVTNEIERRCLLPVAGSAIVAAKTLREQAGKDDGPFGISGFQWKRTSRTGLTAKPFRLLRYLWDANKCTASFRELAKGVWDDEQINLRDNDNRLGSARREINRFMESGPFSFRVQIDMGNELVALNESSAPVTRPKTPAKKKKTRGSPRPARPARPARR